MKLQDLLLTEAEIRVIMPCYKGACPFTDDTGCVRCEDTEGQTAQLQLDKIKKHIKEAREEIAKHCHRLACVLADEHEFTMNAYTWDKLDQRFRDYYLYLADQIIKLLMGEEE